jgi:quinoprotein glucose dehydrogenase
MKKSTKVIGASVLVCFAIIYASLAIHFPRNSDHNTWTQYGGGPDQSRYFAGSQITRDNVKQLKVAWEYPTGDDLPNLFSPIVVDTVMYVLAKNYSLVAISAISGKEIWIHANMQGISRRGINYWESKDKKDKRLLFTLKNTLQAIDAQTGQSIMTFGNGGYVDLREGLGREASSIRRIQSMMPGVIFDNLIMVGSAPGEDYFSAPGDIRAYNVVTGRQEWIFHTIPHPGEFGYDTWPKDAYKYVGGVNVWGEMSVDTKRGIVFLPLGSPTFDFYGADRIGSNLFATSLVALDARTGKRIWHFQTVHHDLWDYDLTSAPQLITVKRDGKSIDAVSIATKHGFIFVFDRVTGKPVFPIEEKPFPASDMPGEKAWPTQPVPTVVPTFTRHRVTKEDLNPYLSEEEKRSWYKRIDSARSGLFVPPSDKYETIMMPGALGGVNFGSAASDPDKGMMYILAQEYPSVYKLETVKPPSESMSTGEVEKAKLLYATTCQPCHGAKMLGAGSAPNIVTAGQRLNFYEFIMLLTTGRGQMPGFAHIDQQTMTAMYRYLGGNPMKFGSFGNRQGTMQKPQGAVVASGGVAVKPDEKTVPAMSDYPEGVDHPKDRYSTDYGTTWPDLAAPPWSRVMSYDLNNGKIKWQHALGENKISMAKGDKNAGAPSGSLRKGLIVTSSGIVFCTGKGGKLSAYDTDSGDLLWETTLSHESEAQPMMYEIKGKQYLVVNASARFAQDSFDHSTEPGALPKGYVVYTLPDK